MRAAPQHQDDPLTGRQKECMLLLQDGLSSKQIARELVISPRTVDQHISAALENLGVHSRLEAVSLLHDQELVEVSEGTEPPQAPSRDKRQHHLSPLPRPSEVYRRSGYLPIFPPIGGGVNAASTKDRIIWIIRIGILSLMLTCLAVVFILGLSEMVRHVSG